MAVVLLKGHLQGFKVQGFVLGFMFLGLEGLRHLQPLLGVRAGLWSRRRRSLASKGSSLGSRWVRHPLAACECETLSDDLCLDPLCQKCTP